MNPDLNPSHFKIVQFLLSKKCVKYSGTTYIVYLGWIQSSLPSSMSSLKWNKVISITLYLQRDLLMYPTDCFLEIKLSYIYYT